MYTNGKAPGTTSVLLLLPEAFTFGFKSRLMGYNLCHVTTPEAAEKTLRETPFDAIIAMQHDAANILFFEQLRALHPYPTRPLLFLLTDNFEDAPQPADATLTLETTAATLKAFLQLRHDAQLALREIQHKQAMLEAENAALKLSLQEERRVKDEVEILKSAIVRNVSHELRTPLVQVKSAVAMLAEDTQNEKLAEYATESTARLEILVKNITMLGESLENNPGPVVVREMIDYVGRSLRRIWERRESKDRIRVEIPPEVPPVFADKQGFSTVLFQLLDNALKFSKNSVVVRAALSDDRNTVCFSVIDDGIGIAPDKLEKIFELFYQVDPSSTRRYGGMGVGLALVKLILDNHKTHIHVHSELGKGSIFTFTLPTMQF